MKLLSLWILLNLFQIATGVYSAAKETEIRSETMLATTYDLISRPVAQTTVKVGLSLLSIDELDLKAQKFSAAGWLTFEWDDDRLTWDKAAKDDVEFIFSPPAKIWKPELVIDNALDSLGVIEDAALYLRVKYTGKVEWKPPISFTTHCEVDITYYPYDQQKCSIAVASWGYTLDEVKLEHLRTEINLEDFATHGEWTVKKTLIEDSVLTETASDGSVETFPQLKFWFYLERRTDFYNLNVMMPIILTSLLVSLVFVVPVESGEKLSYVLTVLLALAVLLTLVADALPPTSISTSVLGLYLGIVLVTAAVGVVLTVVILILYHKKEEPVQMSYGLWFIRLAAKLSRHKLAVNCTGKSVRKVAPVDEIPPSPEREHSEMEIVAEADFSWKDVASILDKFCFIAFSFVTLVMNIAFTIALVAGGKANSP